MPIETPSAPSRHRLDGVAVDVWLAAVDAVPAAVLAGYPELLDEAERERWQRFRFAADRRLYLVAHALLRTTLSRYAPTTPAAWRFVAGAHGKPALAASPDDGLRFNLSHAGGRRVAETTGAGIAACVVARGRAVGIDVEALHRGAGALEVARRSFAPAEVAALDALPEARREDAAVATWALKEAYIKARGLGLSLPLGGFAIALDPPRLLAAADDDPGRWQLELLPVAAGHAVAVAVERAPGERVRVSTRWTVPEAVERGSWAR